MPSVYDLKPKFQALLRPLVQRLAGAGVTANQVTIAALVLSIAAGLTVACFANATWPMLLVPAVLFIRMALNAVDGMLAREHNQKSALGAILNELGDVLSDTVLYLPFALIAGIQAGWVVAVVVLAIVSEMTGVVAIQIGASRRYDGPMGKSDRAFVFGVVGLLLGLGVPASPWLDFVLMGMAVLLVLTVVNRSRQALKEIAR
jgi:CDP-diacylglycerol--glycerol-3-phosphate 3-phosphatidyltransferase